MRVKIFSATILLLLFYCGIMAQNVQTKLGIIGLSHDHVHWIFNEATNQNFVIAGIYETDQSLVSRYQKQYNLDSSLFYQDLDSFFRQEPDGVCIFSSIADHYPIAKKALKLGIHCMVEKPMTLTFREAKQLLKLSNKHNVLMLTNFETSWYPGLYRSQELIDEGFLGKVRKIVIHMGHQGPKEIGCSEEFLAWLTDPKLNGGGALTDFGCYGSNIATWLLPDHRPISVTALAHNSKPDLYPDVDDEATILVEYKDLQVIIQASWNWPFNRKDVTIYGTQGYLKFDRSKQLTYRKSNTIREISMPLDPIPKHRDDPFSYFCYAIHNNDRLSSNPSDLETNIVAMRILAAARRAAKSGKTIVLF